MLLLGIPDPSRAISSTATVISNLFCLVAVLDFLYRGQFLHQAVDLSFSRLGYVDEASARIVVRSPENPAVEMTVFPLSDSSKVQTKIHGSIADTDFMTTFTFDNLAPQTEYVYMTNATHNGTFRTALSTSKKWSLVTSSCIKPFYPYSPLDHALRIVGLEQLSRYVTEQTPDVMLFLGDFIYIDLPVPHGWSQAHYNTAYRQVYASPSWTSSLRTLPWIHLYDDHEIVNDWSAQDTGLYQPAMKAFWNYQGRANPPSKDGRTYYTFRKGDVAFFVMDTRRYRSANGVSDGPAKTMLGYEQRRELESWLENERTWKVVVSSVPFTRNWRGPDANDSWSGYLWERDRILDKMRQTEGVVILSGVRRLPPINAVPNNFQDRHEHATTIFPGQASDSGSVIEFSTSPLNQFFEPFARYHEQIEPSDVSIHHHPRGNSKFGHVIFDSSETRRLAVHYKLIVDGNEVWAYNWTIARDGSQ